MVPIRLEVVKAKMASWCARVKDMMVYLTLSRFSLSKPQVERVFLYCYSTYWLSFDSAIIGR